jgi:hypothetical protein
MMMILESLSNIQHFETLGKQLFSTDVASSEFLDESIVDCTNTFITSNNNKNNENTNSSSSSSLNLGKCDVANIFAKYEDNKKKLKNNCSNKTRLVELLQE